MGAIKTQSDTAFRDYVTEGVPASGPHEPIKSEIRAIFPKIEAADAAIALAGVITVKKTTKALLDADLAHAAGVLAIVYSDGDNNGIYAKLLGSGSGSWDGPLVGFSASPGEAGEMTQIIATVGAPDSGDGADGYYAIDSLTGDWYGPKDSGGSPVWPSLGYNSTGPQGETGASGDLETSQLISLSREQYAADRTFGPPVPTTGSNPNNSVFVYNTMFEEDGEILEFGWRGVNATASDGVHLKILEVDGTDWTQISETTHDTTSGEVNLVTVGGGFVTPPTFEAGQTWGTYSHGASALIPYVSNGAPPVAYWESTGGNHTGTFARGSFVSIRAMQCYIVVRYASGRIQRLLAALAEQGAVDKIYGKNSVETFATGTGTLGALNTTIVLDPRPIPWPGPIKSWRVNVETPGGTPAPMTMFLVEVDDDGNAVDIYSAFMKVCDDGDNTFSRADGTLPELAVRTARRVFPGYITQTNGAKIKTTAGSNTVPSAGYGLTVVITGARIGPGVIAVNTTNVRFDHQIVVQAIEPEVANKVIIDRTFGGSVRPWDVKGTAADLVFGATGVKIAPGAFGMSKGITACVEEALNKSRVIETITLGAYDAPVVGKRLTLGIYGTAVILDVATDTLEVVSISGNTLGTSGAGTKLAGKTAPFATAMAAGDVITLIGQADDRKHHLWVLRSTGEMAQFTSTADIVTNASGGAKSNAAIIADTAAQGTTLTLDIDTWADETDLKRMGMWKGAMFFACNRATATAWTTATAYSVGNMVTESGSYYYCRTAHTSGTFATDLAAAKWGLWTSTELNSWHHSSDDLDADAMMITDSMGDSRAPFVTSWFGLMRAKFSAVGQKMLLNSVHGVNTTGHRIHSNRVMDYMDRLKVLHYAGGMNDTTPVDAVVVSSPVATSGGQADFVIHQAYDRGIGVVVSDVFLTFIGGGASGAENNNGNKELTTWLRATAANIGAPVVTFKDTASISHAGLLRLESWFFGTSDAHLLPATGHYQAAKQTLWQGGKVMGLSMAGLGPLFF